MGIPFDIEAASAAFAQPACDGSFDSDFAAYLGELGESRPSVLLAFAPKAAGTYLRSAAVTATGGALVRTVHAQGGRDASLYLPTFLNYYAFGFPAQTMVTHVHMQALPANRHLMSVLGLRPVIMMRPIPDMLASYLDMLEQDCASPDNWLNICVPHNYPSLSDEAKAEFIIEMMAPWYVSYFSTWLDYAKDNPDVLVLEYADFCADPAATLEKLLAHSRIPCSREACSRALEAVWEDRGSFRYNKGVSGRGAARFSQAQIARLRHMMSFYEDLAGVTDRLIPRL